MNEIQKGDAPSDVALGDVDHQAQVGADEQLLSIGGQNINLVPPLEHDVGRRDGLPDAPHCRPALAVGEALTQVVQHVWRQEIGGLHHVNQFDDDGTPLGILAPVIGSHGLVEHRRAGGEQQALLQDDLIEELGGGGERQPLVFGGLQRELPGVAELFILLNQGVRQGFGASVVPQEQPQSCYLGRALAHNAQPDFLMRLQQVHAANFPQIHAYRVVYQVGGAIGVFLFNLLQIICRGFFVPAAFFFFLFHLIFFYQQVGIGVQLLFGGRGFLGSGSPVVTRCFHTGVLLVNVSVVWATGRVECGLTFLTVWA
ncbi:MAG: hypothetical protein BWY25_01640 [Chloroflexi bacterium ADurb.Bin222]|nr:MAG: hypothetical protein BWY25_01640 [Chloroflexi bacterium ADurb.Bin222]